VTEIRHRTCRSVMGREIVTDRGVQSAPGLAKCGVEEQGEGGAGRGRTESVRERGDGF
jgi:hypothetical protein